MKNSNKKVLEAISVNELRDLKKINSDMVAKLGFCSFMFALAAVGIFEVLPIIGSILAGGASLTFLGFAIKPMMECRNINSKLKEINNSVKTNSIVNECASPVYEEVKEQTVVSNSVDNKESTIDLDAIDELNYSELKQIRDAIKDDLTVDDSQTKNNGRSI